SPLSYTFSLHDALPIFEECEFDGEGRALDFAAEFLDELGGCGGGASGGQKVVADDYAFTRFNGVFVNFECVRSVFQSVGDSGGRSEEPRLNSSHGSISY